MRDSDYAPASLYQAAAVRALPFWPDPPLLERRGGSERRAQRARFRRDHMAFFPARTAVLSSTVLEVKKQGPKLKEGLRSGWIVAPPLVYVLPCQLAVPNTTNVRTAVKRRIINVLNAGPFLGVPCARNATDYKNRCGTLQHGAANGPTAIPQGRQPLHGGDAQTTIIRRSAPPHCSFDVIKGLLHGRQCRRVAQKEKPPGEPGGKFNREALQGTDKHPKDDPGGPGEGARPSMVQISLEFLKNG